MLAKPESTVGAAGDACGPELGEARRALGFCGVEIDDEIAHRQALSPHLLLLVLPVQGEGPFDVGARDREPRVRLSTTGHRHRSDFDAAHRQDARDLAQLVSLVLEQNLQVVGGLHAAEVYGRSRAVPSGRVDPRCGGASCSSVAARHAAEPVLLALATRSDLPSWEVDDRHFHGALAAAGMGFELVVWDDPAIDWRRFGAVLVRTTWDYQDKLPAFLAWARSVAAVTRLFNPVAVVEWNTHKHYLRQLAAHGVPLAATRWLARGERVRVADLMAASGWHEGFLKPCVGATARETLRFPATVHGIAAAQAHVDRLLPHEDLMLQPFLSQVLSRGEWSAIFVDGVITHCVRKIPVAGDYRVQDDFGAKDERYEPTPAERQLAMRTMAVVQAVGGPCPGADGRPLLYGRADFLWGDDGGCVLTELELVEPSLFFRHAAAAATALTAALVRRL